jgi:hypothetical protein
VNARELNLGDTIINESPIGRLLRVKVHLLVVLLLLIVAAAPGWIVYGFWPHVVESSRVKPMEIGELAGMMNKEKLDTNSNLSEGTWVAFTGKVAAKSPGLEYFEVCKPNVKNGKVFAVMTDAEVPEGTIVTVVGRIGKGNASTSHWAIHDPNLSTTPPGAH